MIKVKKHLAKLAFKAMTDHCFAKKDGNKIIKLLTLAIEHQQEKSCITQLSSYKACNFCNKKQKG